MKNPPAPLLAVPTACEMEPLLHYAGLSGWPRLITGIGPGATALNLTRFLERNGKHTVILAGLAGAFPDTGASPGWLCVATSEAYADLGRCGPDSVEPVRIKGEKIPLFFPLEQHLDRLLPPGFPDLPGIFAGPMITVCCTSGTRTRVEYFRKKFGCVAENMEGAAAAQVCREYDTPMLELRGISNWAGDQDKTNWQIQPALEKLSNALKILHEHWQKEKTE